MKPYSPSQIAMYQRCPAAWGFRYAEGLKVPPPGHLLVGTALHEAAETNSKQKVASRIDLPESDLADAAATSFDARLAQEGGILPDPEVTTGDCKDEAVELARVYHRLVAPTFQPAKVEQKFQLTFEGVPYGFVGRIDVEDDRRQVRDLKSTARTPSAVEPHVQFQLAAYAMAHEADCGELPPACVNDNIVKLKTPKAVSLSFVPTAEDVRLVRSTIAEVHAGIQAESFPPNRSSFFCSRRQCGFAPYCETKYGGKVRP